MDTNSKGQGRKQPQLPGNWGGETLRQYCGLSRQRKIGRLHFEEPGVSSQDLFRAIGKHTSRPNG